MIKKFKILAILPFLAIMTSVKAYDLTGIPKATRIDYGLYYDTTLLTSPLPSCTSSNEYDCYITDRSLPNASNTYNNFRIVVRDDMDTNFAIGTQYKISMYFEQDYPGYWLSSGRITQVTGNTYRNFTNWTTDDITIISYSLSLLDNADGMYRFDVVFTPSTTQIAGFNFRIWQDYESVSNDNNYYIRMWRNVGISQLTPGQIDYTQNLDDINTSIGNLSDDISDSTQDIIDNQNANTQAIIDSNKACQTKTYTWSSLSTKGYINNDDGYTLNTSNANWRVSDFVRVYSGEVIVVQNFTTNTVKNCYYNSAKEVISCFFNNAGTYTVPDNAYYIRFNVFNNNLCSTSIKTCKNAANAVDDLNDTITDDTPPDLSALQNSAGWLPPGPVDSILNLPLALFNNLNTNLSKTCQPVTVALPLVSSNISLPCISTVYAQMPNLANFLNWIGYLAAGIILYKYFLHLYKWVDNTLTFRENNWLDNWGGD